jgi:hypothetical protein
MVTPGTSFFENWLSIGSIFIKIKHRYFLFLMRTTSDPLPTTNTLTLSAKKPISAFNVLPLLRFIFFNMKSAGRFVFQYLKHNALQ